MSVVEGEKSCPRQMLTSQTSHSDSLGTACSLLTACTAESYVHTSVRTYCFGYKNEMEMKGRQKEKGTNIIRMTFKKA